MTAPNSMTNCDGKRPFKNFRKNAEKIKKVLIFLTDLLLFGELYKLRVRPGGFAHLYIKAHRNRETG